VLAGLLELLGGVAVAALVAQVLAQHPRGLFSRLAPF
jgi:hypothetical protein